MRLKRILSKTLAVAVLLAPVAGVAHAEDLSVEKIVENTNRVSYYQGKDGRAEVLMEIVDAQKRERTKEMIILRMDMPKPEAKDADKQKKDDDEKKADQYCGDQKFYVYFERPADERKSVFMVWKHLDDKEDYRWLYLPGLDLVKRIASADKRTQFVGSHFFYEDVSGRHIDADKHELVKTTDTYYVLKNTPKDPKAVEFDHFEMWIHKDTFVVVKTEYFDKQGKKYRMYEAKEVKDIQGFKTVTKSRMTDLRTGGYTDLTYRDVKYNVGLEEDIFTERYLRRPPYKYLK